MYIYIYIYVCNVNSYIDNTHTQATLIMEDGARLEPKPANPGTSSINAVTAAAQVKRCQTSHSKARHQATPFTHQCRAFIDHSLDPPLQQSTHKCALTHHTPRQLHDSRLTHHVPPSPPLTPHLHHTPPSMMPRAGALAKRSQRCARDISFK